MVAGCSDGAKEEKVAYLADVVFADGFFIGRFLPACSRGSEAAGRHLRVVVVVDDDVGRRSLLSSWFSPGCAGFWHWGE